MFWPQIENENLNLYFNNEDNNALNLSFSKDYYDNNLTLNEDDYYENLSINPLQRLYEEMRTAPRTNSKFYSNTKESEKDNLPEFISFPNIIDFLSKYIVDEEIKKKLNEGKCIINTKEYDFIRLTKKKRKHEKEKEKEKDNSISKKVEINISNSKIIKRGRKKKFDSKLNIIHDKMSVDNILKKLKTKLFKYILNFLNKILNLEGENKLVKLDYSLIDKLKRNNELSLFDKTLKDIYSMNISNKFKTKPKNFNELIIKKVLNREIPPINDWSTKISVLNITYDNFIQFFIHKKNLEDLIIDHSYNNINILKIKENFPFVESFINEIYRKNDAEYSSFLLFYLFNLKRTISLKQIRKTN